MFKGNQDPKLTEDQEILMRKRAELGRVLKRLEDPNLRPGLAREPRKHAEALEREITRRGEERLDNED